MKLIKCSICGEDKSKHGSVCRSCTNKLHGEKVKKHGDSQNNKLYYMWRNMRSRCNNSNNKKFKRYGGRGIKVCNEWNKYEVFRNWAISNGYELSIGKRGDAMSIDRIDVDGNYEPSNCQFIKHRVNSSKDFIKLTKTNAIAIKCIKEYFNLSNSKIGKLFGCGQTLIHKVINNKAKFKGVVNELQ